MLKVICDHCGKEVTKGIRVDIFEPKSQATLHFCETCSAGFLSGLKKYVKGDQNEKDHSLD